MMMSLNTCMMMSLNTCRYHASIVQGVESWNNAFRAAGFKHKVVECVAPADPKFPADYNQGDARFSVVYLALSPRLPVLGFGPSIVDCRSGEIMRAHVLLGLEPMIRSASRSSFEALEGDGTTFTDRQPLLPADHPDVLKTIVSVVAHEIGHCLGLRHNFIAAEDGNSSVMEYTEDTDTASNPLDPCYGALFLYEPGVYDIYAIKYGYTTLKGEQAGQRHPSLALLGNGQEPNDHAGVAAVARNPLFATDGCVGGPDPRVNRFMNRLVSFGRDKLEAYAAARGKLLSMVQSGAIKPEVYTSQIKSQLNMVVKTLVYSAKVVGGVLFDPKKIKGTPAPAWYVHAYLQSVLDTLLGPSFRFTAAEGEHLLELYGEYSLEPVSVLSFHMRATETLLRETLRVDRLARLEEHAALLDATSAVAENRSASSGGGGGSCGDGGGGGGSGGNGGSEMSAAPGQAYDTLRMLRELAGLEGIDGSGGGGGGGGRGAQQTLFGALQNVAGDGGNDSASEAAALFMERSARDRYSCQVRWALIDSQYQFCRSYPFPAHLFVFFLLMGVNSKALMGWYAR